MLPQNLKFHLYIFVRIDSAYINGSEKCGVLLTTVTLISRRPEGELALIKSQADRVPDFPLFIYRSLRWEVRKSVTYVVGAVKIHRGRYREVQTRRKRGMTATNKILTAARKREDTQNSDTTVQNA
jgi:hypothetical protein